jgi:hypothetical protein
MLMVESHAIADRSYRSHPAHAQFTTQHNAAR